MTDHGVERAWEKFKVRWRARRKTTCESLATIKQVIDVPKDSNAYVIRHTKLVGYGNGRWQADRRWATRWHSDHQVFRRVDHSIVDQRPRSSAQQENDMGDIINHEVTRSYKAQTTSTQASARLKNTLLGVPEHTGNLRLQDTMALWAHGRQ